MKKITQVLLTLAILLICFETAFSQALDVKTLGFIDSLIRAGYNENGPGISLLIAKDGIPLYRKAFGVADAELNVKMTSDNVLAIGSMTKQFTAVSILILEEQGKLNLGDEITKYIPLYNTHGRKITIENCLTHTSGIPSYTENDGFDSLMVRRMSLDELLALCEKDSLLFEPGSDFSYSNSGYVILGAIIEKVSGMSYEDFVRKNIFSKAGMKHSYFGSNSEIIPMRAKGYQRGAEGFENASYFDWSWPFSAGNIISCLSDLLLWDDALYSDIVVSQSELKRAWTPFTTTRGMLTNYGYGWGVVKFGDMTVIDHGGAINGYLSDAVRIPEKHLYIAALTNYTGMSPDGIVKKIMLKITGYQMEKPKQISVDKSVLEQYCGAYESKRESARLITNLTNEKSYRYVMLEGDTLKIQRTGGVMFALIPYDKDKFYIHESERRFTFMRDAGGKITALMAFDYPVNLGPEDIGRRIDSVQINKRKEIALDMNALNRFVGEYELQPGFTLKMFTEDGRFYTQATGQQKIELFAESEYKYFMKVVDAQLEFVPEADGSVNKVNLFQGMKYECKRIR